MQIVVEEPTPLAAIRQMYTKLGVKPPVSFKAKGSRAPTSAHEWFGLRSTNYHLVASCTELLSGACELAQEQNLTQRFWSNDFERPVGIYCKSRGSPAEPFLEWPADCQPIEPIGLACKPLLGS